MKIRVTKETKESVATKNTSPAVYPVMDIKVDIIDPSPANKRHIDPKEKSIVELADNIQANGLLQAIIVRKMDKGRFECVAGHRRLVAFKVKGWPTIQATVRELDDFAAHDITASENLQREDLTPIEESESIKVLLDDGRTPEEIADKLSKPVSWVTRRARICELSPQWLKAIRDPKMCVSHWSATHLELIARYDHKRQDELFGEYDGTIDWNSDTAVMTVKDLERQLNEELLALSGAPWKIDDETLVTKAGSCSACQKRTSCSPSLFEPIEEKGVAKSDRCMDRECWGKKLVAFHAQNIALKREKYPGMLLMSNDGGAKTLPQDCDLKKNCITSYKYNNAQKSDKGALPVYVVDGPGSGTIRWMTPDKTYSRDSARPVGEDGKPAAKSMKERRAALDKRRRIRYVVKIIEILRGENDAYNLLEIAGKISQMEVLALICEYGANINGTAGKWKAFSATMKKGDIEATADALTCIYRPVIRDLQMSTYGDPDKHESERILGVLKIETAPIWQAVLDEIPEPKSWAGLKADGTPKAESTKKEQKPKKGAGKSTADLVDNDSIKE